MSQYLVGTTSELLAAVKAAKSGDVVLVKSGTYSGVNLSGINTPGNVTIASTSADSPAKFLDLTLKSSSGLTFSNLQFAPPSGSANYTFNVGSSANIHFDSIKMFGPAGDKGYHISPFLIRNSRNVTVTDSEFTHAWHGVTVMDSASVSFTDSYFHDLRTDGIRAAQVTGLTITGNHITDMRPQGADHADGIQLWTINTTASSRNIVIADNLITRGDGAAFQGIFLRDEVGTLPYKNLSITGNTVIGTLSNGISVGHVENLTMTSNTVAGFGDQNTSIRTASRVSGIVSDNQATTYHFSDANHNLTNSNNRKILIPLDGGSSLVQAWLSKNSALYSSTGSALYSPLTELRKGSSDTVTHPADTPMSTISGTSGADVLRATSIGNSKLNGYAGNDGLHGGSGQNELAGGTGDDVYYVKGAGDVVVEAASSGKDTVWAYVSHKLSANVETLRLAAAGLTGEGNDAANRIVGSTGSDVIYGHGADDRLEGNSRNDAIFGGSGNDTIMGGEGNDRLEGGDGNDLLSGGAGYDLLVGGAGKDRLDGGVGSVHHMGGTGADMFIFRALDKTTVAVITDFNKGEGDRIDLTQIDARTATHSDDYFRFIGTAGFTKSAGQLRYSVVDGDAHVYGDVNGDGAADFDLVLQNVRAVDAGLFIL